MRKRLTEEQAAFLDDLAVCYSGMLMQYAMRFLNYRQHLQPLAQECVQESFVKAIACVEELMVHENPVGWLKVVLKHKLLNCIKSARFQREELHEDISAHPQAMQQSVAEALALWEQHQQLTDVLSVAQKLLTEEEQRTFELYIRDGMTIAETALLESVPVSTIRGRINRIRQKLRKHFPELCILLLLSDYL